LCYYQETKVFWNFRKGLIPIIGGSRCAGGLLAAMQQSPVVSADCCYIQQLSVKVDPYDSFMKAETTGAIIAA
jgi:hypothetical protein